MPLARVYPCWNNVGTVKLITDYLYRKIYQDLKSKNLLDPLLSNMNMVEKVYSGFPLENPQFVISQSKTPEENLKTIIEKTFVGMLDNISRTSEYSSLNLSVFDAFDSQGRENIYYERYQRSLFLFFQEMRSQLKQGNYGNLGLSDEEKAIADEILAEIIDYDNLSVTPFGEQLGSYYFPISFLYANYLIFYDHSVKYGERYSEIYYRSQVEIAASDDFLLTAIRGQSYSRFSDLFIGFPVSVTTYNDSFNITYYSQPQVQERIDYLDELLTNPDLIEINTIERTRIEELDPNLLQFADNGWRYIDPTLAPNEYFEAIRQLFIVAADSTVDTIRDFNAWWLDESYQTVEDDEYESLFRLHSTFGS